MDIICADKSISSSMTLCFRKHSGESHDIAWPQAARQAAGRQQAGGRQQGRQQARQAARHLYCWRGASAHARYAKAISHKCDAGFHHFRIRWIRLSVNVASNSARRAATQRIAAIARAIPEIPILILDEATSSLDEESERQFKKRITHERKNIDYYCSPLIHIREADCIYVLVWRRNRGSTVQHRWIARSDGFYHHLISLQLENESKPAVNGKTELIIQ